MADSIDKQTCDFPNGKNTGDLREHCDVHIYIYIWRGGGLRGEAEKEKSRYT